MKNVTVTLTTFEADVLLSLIRNSDRFTNTANVIFNKVDTALGEVLNADDNHHSPDDE